MSSEAKSGAVARPLSRLLPDDQRTRSELIGSDPFGAGEPAPCTCPHFGYACNWADHEPLPDLATRSERCVTN